MARPKIRTPEEIRQRDNAAARAYWKRKRGERRALRQMQHAQIPADSWDMDARVRPPDEVLAECEYRRSLPRTISQMLLGDPPPGYSALDKRH